MKRSAILFITLLFSVSMFAQMTLEFNTTLSTGTTITIPLDDMVDVSIDWGDDSGVEEFITSGNKNHTYATEGIYTVEISGSLTTFGAYDYENADKMTRVLDFGELGITSFTYAFYNAINIIEVPTSIPSTVTDLSYMFSGALSFNQDIGSWDVIKVINMSGMFSGATNFNQSIGSWNVGNVTNMSNMFKGNDIFNKYIGAWNVNNVTNMSGMFQNSSSFNQYIGPWNVGNVVDMSNMFKGNDIFDGNIGSWDVSKVINMSGMFQNAFSFNQYIGSWNVGNVTNMSDMFYRNSDFNQDIGMWDVGNVTNMSYMFYKNNDFNQNIGMWDVGNVTNMSYMFWECHAYNQDIRDWDVSNVINMLRMFGDVTLSTINYDALLNSWSEQTLQQNLTFDGGNSQYSCEAEAARASIINNNLWMIADGGQGNGIDITTQAVSQETCEGCTVVLSIEADGLNLSYQWRKDGVDIVDEVNTVGSTTNELTLTNLTDEDLGVYNCLIFGDCGEQLSDDAILIFDVGILELYKNKISIYPNPTIGQFQIEAKDLTEIEILSATGQLIRTFKANKQQTTVDLSQEAKGIYFVKLISSKGIETAKLVLE